VRLDKFLKISRLIKRRTVANHVAQAGHITVNGKPAKPATQIKAGDVIALHMGSPPPVTVKILLVPLSKAVPVDVASTLYQVISQAPTTES
jgi:ribosomal 50S subunit-recycling heat shock protein